MRGLGNPAGAPGLILTPGLWAGFIRKSRCRNVGSLKAGFVTETSAAGSCRAFSVQCPILREVGALYSADRVSVFVDSSFTHLACRFRTMRR